MNRITQNAPKRFSASFRWAGFTLGFAISGFFDGILLHQVLQWHHLLSAVDGGRFGDLRFQILADGLFHLLMYGLALVGLLLLFRSRSEFGRPNADRLLLANALVGFGVWHILDGIVSHWVLGIHRIRMDSQIPLVWDLFWFFLFGVVFVVFGWLARPSGGTSGGSRAAPGVLSILAVFLAFGAALPPPESSATVVVFRPGISPGQAMAVVAKLEGQLIWSDQSDQVWAIDLPDNAGMLEFYRNGALFVSGTLVPSACVSWTQI